MAGAHGEAMRTYSIYEKPLDFPNSFVVREWVIDDDGLTPGDLLGEAVDLEGARALLPANLVRLDRFADDDPKIVEV